MLLTETGLKYNQLAELLGFNRSVLSKIAGGKQGISAEYKVRCVECLKKPGFRFNIFWFENPEKEPFWIPEGDWTNLYSARVLHLATIRPDFLELLEKAARLSPERREKWLRVVRELFELQDP